MTVWRFSPDQTIPPVADLVAEVSLMINGENSMTFTNHPCCFVSLEEKYLPAHQKWKKIFVHSNTTYSTLLPLPVQDQYIIFVCSVG